MKKYPVSEMLSLSDDLVCTVTSDEDGEFIYLMFPGKSVSIARTVHRIYPNNLPVEYIVYKDQAYVVDCLNKTA